VKQIPADMVLNKEKKSKDKDKDLMFSQHLFLLFQVDMAFS
jgi:hypothetical protein